MPKTSTERTRKWRARKIERLGLGEYKKDRRLEGREYRERKKEEANGTSKILAAAKELLKDHGKERGNVLESQAKERKEERKLFVRLIGAKPTAKKSHGRYHDEGSLSDGEIREYKHEPILDEEEHLDDDQHEPALFDEEKCSDDEETSVGNVGTYNRRWKQGDSIISLPLTERSRTVWIDRGNDSALSIIGTKIVQEAFETHIPTLKKKDGLGKILEQVEDDLPRKVLKSLRYILKHRNHLVHKKWLYQLENRKKYEKQLKFVLEKLCPKWELCHDNPEAERLRQELDDANAEIERLRQELYDAEHCRPTKRHRREYY